MIIQLAANGTIDIVEMDIGDTLEYRLRSGEIRTFVLNKTNAGIIYTNLEKPKEGVPGGATVYHFTCELVVDGCPMVLERYVGCQESFYEPYVINGVRIWFDAVADLYDFMVEGHIKTKPKKQARFAICDMTERICPDELKPWIPLPPDTLDIKDCYCADDCWLGPYFGANAHNGLDVNHPKGTPVWAPIDFDDHFLFNSLAEGHNNNRWRGVRTWPNGDTWYLQIHHIYNLFVPEHAPLKAGTLYADAAGAQVGLVPHSHFVFLVKEQGGIEERFADPWILFWQMYEDIKERTGAIKAVINPLSPRRAGEVIAFSSSGSRKGPNGRELSFRWLFGDGGWSDQPHPTYTYAQPGVYPVTLIVSDEAQTASFTQHITITGEAVEQPALVLEAAEPEFRGRPVQAVDVYGKPPRFVPHTLFFTARPTRPKPYPKVLSLKNAGKGELPAAVTAVEYINGNDWLELELDGSGNSQQLFVSCSGAGLAPGRYAARVHVTCPGAVNETQGFDVQLLVPLQDAGNKWLGNTPRQIIDDRDLVGFYATPWFWVGCHVKTVVQGYGGFHLTNGGRAAEDQFVRFTPDLPAGKHQVSFAEETPFADDSAFWVVVRHRDGVERIWMEPAKSRIIGSFYFDEGTDGYVEIHTKDSRGPVLADAVVFLLLDETNRP